MATVAPKAAAPLVEVPAPRCIWILSTEEAKSGMFTQKTVCDSESFTGTPLTVMLIRLASVPRMRNPE